MTHFSPYVCGYRDGLSDGRAESILPDDVIAAFWKAHTLVEKKGLDALSPVDVRLYCVLKAHIMVEEVEHE